MATSAGIINLEVLPAMDAPRDMSKQMKQLTEMGFDPSVVKVALEATKYDVNIALRCLLRLDDDDSDGVSREGKTSSDDVYLKQIRAELIMKKISMPQLQRTLSGNGDKMDVEAKRKALDVWACQACTLENPIDIPQCSLCRAGRPVLSDKQQELLHKDQWACSACTFLNPKLESKCSLCDSQKPLTVEEKKAKEQQIECGVCYTTVWKTNIRTKGCGHSYCPSCWTRYLVSCVETGQVKSIKCIEPSCNRCLSGTEIEESLNERETKRYRRFKRVQEVNDDPNKSWCLTTNCDSFVTFDGKRSCVRCSKCTKEQCFKCGVFWHTSYSCNQWNEKIKKEQKEKTARGRKKAEKSFETMMKKNRKYKKCGGCKMYIEKSFGCSKMKCRCGYKFCWACGSVGAKCNCNRGHGFWDNIDDRGDFS